MDRLNELEPSIALFDDMTALYLLGNDNVDASQRISIQAAAAPKTPISFLILLLMTLCAPFPMKPLPLC